MKTISKNEEVREAIELLKSCGFENRQSLLETLCRVVKTREALEDKEGGAETVYRAMREVSSSMPRFPGDADLFYSVYEALAGIDGRGIAAFVNMADEGYGLTVPDALAAELFSRVTDDVGTVLVTECRRYGTVLLDAAEAHPGAEFTLTCEPGPEFDLLSVAYRSCANVTVTAADIYSLGFTRKKYALIISVPMFGGRTLVSGEHFICRETDLIAVENLLRHIDTDGELVMALPARIAFGGGSVAKLREHIENNYRVKEIGVLPAGLFLPCTAIRTYLFVFSTGTTGDVILKRYEPDRPIGRKSLCGRLTVEKEARPAAGKFGGPNGWNVDMAFAEEDSDLRAFASSKVEKTRLREAADVFRGKAVSAKDEGGAIGVINISDMTDLGIDYSGINRIDEEKRKASRYILQDGDVLVTARGTKIKVAVFEGESGDFIPSANINVIRPGDKLKGAYLKLFLESPAGGKMLRGLQRGTGVVNINYQDMAELEVPVPPLEVQEALIDEYNAGLTAYIDIIDAAEEAWRVVRKRIQAKLF